MPETSLAHKSIHELRNIAQGYQVPDLFSMSHSDLVKAIIVKQHGSKLKEKFKPPPKLEYDTRLMTKRPAKATEQDYAFKALEAHIEQGLDITFPFPDQWEMRYRGRVDTGTLRMPAHVLINCANRLMK